MATAAVTFGVSVAVRPVGVGTRTVTPFPGPYCVPLPLEMTDAPLKAVPVEEPDRLTRWAVDYLIQNKDQDLSKMLAAALDRHSR